MRLLHVVHEHSPFIEIQNDIFTTELKQLNVMEIQLSKFYWGVTLLTWFDGNTEKFLLHSTLPITLWIGSHKLGLHAFLFQPI